jgi:uncharacterized protein
LSFFDESEKRIGRKEEKGSRFSRRKDKMNEEKTIIWRRFEAIGAGHEFARVFSKDSKRFLEGAAIFVYEKQFCRLNYRIECDADWQTVSARVFGLVGAETIEIEIAVDTAKRWIINDVENPETANCTDIDLNFSPVTNTLPIRRLNLQTGEKAEVRAAWLRFPSFKLELLEQTYERIAENKYVYESAGGAFRAELKTNDSGIVVDYPHLWQIENS